MVWEDGIPENRIAVVLSKSTQDSYNIIGRNGKVLRFHESLVEIVAKAQEDDDII
jgi:predicted RNA-binding protein Jag